MRDGRTFLLHDVLFVPEIWWNLVSVVVLLRFEFTLNMYSTSIKLYMDDVCYGYEYVSNDCGLMKHIWIIIILEWRYFR
jgi:hypothetical protein